MQLINKMMTFFFNQQFSFLGTVLNLDVFINKKEKANDVFFSLFFPSFHYQNMDSGYLWLSLYFILNLSLTLYNKIILNNFKFPYSLTAIHTLCGTVGCLILYMMGTFTPAKLGDRENMVMVMFSILYTINIAISNVSL